MNVKSIISCLILVCLFSLYATVSADCAPLNLHIAKNGNDQWTGRLAEPNPARTDGPFATLGRARDEIRSMKQSGTISSDGITVLLHGGTYFLKNTFELSERDSGTETVPITYSAFGGEEVRLSGGREVSNFQPVTDAEILKQLDQKARGSVVQADLNALGITDFGSPHQGGLELFFDEIPMQLARWPNEDFVRIAGIVVDDGHEIHGHKGSKTGKFKYDGDRPARWLGEKDPWLHGYWFWDWSDESQRIASIDTGDAVISLATPYHNYGYRKGQWYFAFNMLCELDRPGEWYIDREDGILYFWPPQPIESAKTHVSILPTLVDTKNVSHVSFQGLTFETARGTGISFSGGKRDRIAGCVIRNIGGQGASLSGLEHRVEDCEVYRTGSGGISLSGGDRKTLSPGGHLVENNEVHHYGRIKRMYSAGISLSGVGNKASHNLIHSAPHIAISFNGNEQVIEYNEIHHVCMESNDAGAIYTGRNWTWRGNHIRYNYLHHINGFEEKGCVGVYLDDMFSSAAIYGNVFYKVTRAAFIGGGRDCSIENNIFVDCDPALHIDARAMGWAGYHADEWIKEANEKGTHLGIEFRKPPYSERYPQLVNIIENNPKAPIGNVIERNICWGGKWDTDIEKKARPFLTFKDNMVDEDPHFVDVKNLDFRLKPDSPAYNKGFKPIPMEKIGLKKKSEKQPENTSSINWRQCLRQKDEWYGSREAVRIADNVLLYQHYTGGWPKNIDMAAPLSDGDKEKLIQKKPNKKDSTIDNSATFTQLRYLAKVYNATYYERYKDAFIDGLNFLLKIQYGNGGWPQFPYHKGYYQHITFNDGAMIGVLNLLDDIVNRPEFAFVGSSRKQEIREAIQKGIDCILKCQIVVDGKRTAWCAQHDEITMKPAQARSYELISLSGGESAGVVRYLMSLDDPGPEIIEAVQSAVRWFDDAKLNGIKQINKPDPSLPRGYDKIIVSDPSVPPLWARFYQIGTNKPIFCGRDGIIKDTLAEIEHERRVGYAWYTNGPARVLKDYPEWQKKWAVEKDVLGG